MKFDFCLAAGGRTTREDYEAERGRDLLLLKPEKLVLLYGSPSLNSELMIVAGSFFAAGTAMLTSVSMAISRLSVIAETALLCLLVYTADDFGLLLVGLDFYSPD